MITSLLPAKENLPQTDSILLENDGSLTGAMIEQAVADIQEQLLEVSQSGTSPSIDASEILAHPTRPFIDEIK